MKTKTKFILKSPADLPANTLEVVGLVPVHASEMAKHILAPPVRATRRQIRAAQKRSAEFIKDLSTRANAQFTFALPASSVQKSFAQSSTPAEMSNSWLHGGLNE